MKRRRYLEENVRALDMGLTDDELRRLDETFRPCVAAGERQPDMSTVNRWPRAGRTRRRCRALA
jgi:hypothetical protein